MADSPCFFPAQGDIDIDFEVSGKEDVNANLFFEGAELNFDCDDNDCNNDVPELNGLPIEVAEIQIERQGGGDDPIELRSFLGQAPCLVEGAVQDLGGIQATCVEFEGDLIVEFNGNDIEDPFDMIPILFNFLACDEITEQPTVSPTNKPTVSPTALPTVSPTDQPTASPTGPTESPTEAPTQSPTILVEVDENNNVAAAFGAGVAGGLAVICLFCAFFVARQKQNQRNEERGQLEGKQQPKQQFGKNTTLVNPVGAGVLLGGTSEARSIAISIQRFDTTDLSRMSGLSMLTTNTASTMRSDVTTEDEDNHHRVRSLVADDKRKYAALSQLVSEQVNRLSLNSLEHKYKDEDINEKVLNEVVPFIKSIIKPHAGKAPLVEQFDLKTKPKVSLKFYLSRLIMGLNGWYYDGQKTTEIGLRCLFLSLLYLESLPTKVKGFTVTNINIYKLIATFMLIAAKFTEDDVITNTYWADVCGYTVDDVNELETLLCFKFGFAFDVNPDDLTRLFLLFNAKEFHNSSHEGYDI